MADVKKYTDQIAKAQKGRDVRDSIVNAINAVSDENNEYNQVKADILEAQTDITEKVAKNEQTEQTFAADIREAETLKEALDTSNSNATQTKKNLDATNKTAADLNTALGKNIAEGTQLKSEIQTTGETAAENLQAEAEKQMNFIKTSIDDTLTIKGKAADAEATGKAIKKIESINYTDRGTLAGTDAFMVNDGTGMKKSVLSKLSDFVLNKIADKVFAKLQTNDKTILGAINELNSNTSKLALKENVTDIQALISKASSSTYILFHLSGANYTGNDLPIDATYKYGSGIIFYRNSNSCKIVLFPERAKPVWKMANWEKWKDFVNNTVD